MSRLMTKKLIYQLSKPFPFKLMLQLSHQFFIFPFYHLVSDNPSPLVKHLYPVTGINQFQKDLDFILKYFEVASFDEVLDRAHSDAYTGRPKFFLTFDDGFSECFDVVMPILKERNLPAAFFINPAFVDNRQLSHRQKISLIIENVHDGNNADSVKEANELIRMKFKNSFDLIQVIKKLTIADSAVIDEIAAIFSLDFNAALQQYKPYMNTSQLRELKEAGFHIGSHGYNHPEFNLISEDEMKVQVNRSFQFLNEELGINDRVFSFPFHDIGIPLSFFQFLQNEAGVKASFGTSGIKNDSAPGHIHRIPMELSGFSGAESIIRSEYFYYLGKALARKNLIKRR